MNSINHLLMKASLTKEEVMDILAISENELERLCRTGELSRFKFNNPARYEYMPSTINRYIEKAFKDEE